MLGCGLCLIWNPKGKTIQCIDPFINAFSIHQDIKECTWKGTENRMYSSEDFGLPSLRLLYYLGMLWSVCWRTVSKLYSLAALRGLRDANQEWCLEWDKKAGCDESDRSSRAISLADLEGSSHDSLVQQVSEGWEQLQGQIPFCRKEFPCLASLMQSPVTLEGCCPPLLPISSYVGLLHTPKRMAFMGHQFDPVWLNVGMQVRLKGNKVQPIKKELSNLLGEGRSLILPQSS